MNQTTRPKIYVEIEQPGDRGDFVINVRDPQSGKTISTNRLSESINHLQYLYTASLIERPGGASSRQDSEHHRVRQQQRQEDLIRYGKKLYTDLFGDRPAFTQYLKKAKHLQSGAVIVLRLHSTASELWNIPWEYMHDGERYLNVDAGMTIVRQMSDVRLDTGVLGDASLPLRVLMVISDPVNAPPLNVDHEIAIIKRAVQPAIERNLIHIDFVEEGTLHNLDIRLTDTPYHVLHYTGHGGTAPQGSFLALENDQGHAIPVFIDQLLPVIRRPKSLKLVVLSGCQTGVIEETQAMSGIATGLLQAVPAVVAMQFSILDTSAQVFAESFYGAISRGHSLEDAMHYSRTAMHKANSTFTDWGIPSLYTARPELRLVNPKSRLAGAMASKPATQTAHDLNQLPAPPVFVGRRDQQRTLRAALPDLSYSMAYVWGLGGIGKSALVRNVAERPGRQDLLTGTLVLDASQLQPGDLFMALVSWVETYFPEAGTILRKPDLKPHERIAQAAALVKRKRLLLIIDRFDTLLQQTKSLRWDIPNPAAAQLFESIATAEWSIMTIFTSRYRWSLLADLHPEDFIEMHLDEFDLTDIQHMMSQLTHLQKLDGRTLGAFFTQVGGHPQTVHLVENLMAKRPDKALLKDPRLMHTLVAQWRKHFIGDLLARLNTQERKALQITCILERQFSPDQVRRFAAFDTLEQTELCMARWEALSIVDFLYEDENGQPWYRIPMLIRTAMLIDLKPEILKKLHARAAQMLLDAWYDLANNRYNEVGGIPPNPENKFHTALDELVMIKKSARVDMVSHYVNVALEWRSHYLRAEQHGPAAEIALDIYGFIAFRMNDLEAAREMLETTVKTLPADHRINVLSRMALAHMLMDAGECEKAIAAYEAIKDAVKALNDENYPRVFAHLAVCYQQLGKERKAKRYRKDALKLRQEIGDYEGAARDLVNMGRDARIAGKYSEALDYTNQAERMLEALSEPAYSVLAELFLERGHILYRTERDQQAAEHFSRAINLFNQIGQMSGVAEGLTELADLIRFNGGDLGQAQQMVLQAIDITEQINEMQALPKRLYILGLIYEDQGVYDEAVVQTQRAIELGEQVRNDPMTAIRDALKRQKQKARR